MTRKEARMTPGPFDCTQGRQARDDKREIYRDSKWRVPSGLRVNTRYRLPPERLMSNQPFSTRESVQVQFFSVGSGKVVNESEVTDSPDLETTALVNPHEHGYTKFV